MAFPYGSVISRVFAEGILIIRTIIWKCFRDYRVLYSHTLCTRPCVETDELNNLNKKGMESIVYTVQFYSFFHSKFVYKWGLK